MDFDRVNAAPGVLAREKRSFFVLFLGVLRRRKPRVGISLDRTSQPGTVLAPTASEGRWIVGRKSQCGPGAGPCGATGYCDPPKCHRRTCGQLGGRGAVCSRDASGRRHGCRSEVFRLPAGNLAAALLKRFSQCAIAAITPRFGVGNVRFRREAEDTGRFFASLRSRSGPR